jgi:hypothetical protein
MKQKTTAFCIAAAFGCIATLGAQTQTATTASQKSGSAKDVTITGCLAKGADGHFLLSNAQMNDSAGSSTTSATSTTASTTAGTPAGKTGSAMASTWLLGGSADLEKHLGHKIQVTGKTTWDGSMDHGRVPGATPSAAGTSTTAATSSAAPTSTGTTGSATSTGEQRKESTSEDMSANQPRLDVRSVKMISPACS